MTWIVEAGGVKVDVESITQAKAEIRCNWPWAEFVYIHQTGGYNIVSNGRVIGTIKDRQ